MSERRIKTSCQYPPIPDRRFDWCAYYEGEEEYGNYGWGATEAEAIADFVENYVDEEEEAKQRERDAEARHFGGLSPLGNDLVEAYLLDDEEGQA
jgi:hypothetical protein